MSLAAWRAFRSLRCGPSRARLRECEADEQRLLLASRALIGVHVFGGVARFEVAAVRTIERPARAGVAAAYVAQERGEVFLDVSALGAHLEALLQQAFEHQDGLGKRAVGTRIDRFLQTAERLHARGGDGGAVRRHLALKPTEPRIVKHAVAEETLALAHRALVGGGGVAVFGGACEREAIEEAAAVAGWARP
jgi:hypothetical protein